MLTPTAIAQLAGLFAAAFGAATLLPFQSEIVFAAMQVAGNIPVWLLIVVASIGNTGGSVVNYVMGLGVERFHDSRWFPVTPAQLDRAQRWYARWGVWTLLLSWAPFGDGFTVVAGMMRTRFWLFLVLVAIAKTGRYAVLAWATAQAGGGAG
jgi:membrane protein YqaA with SNARE-associated domain